MSLFKKSSNVVLLILISLCLTVHKDVMVTENMHIKVRTGNALNLLQKSI